MPWQTSGNSGERRRRRIGEVLVEQGVITAAQLDQVLRQQADPTQGRHKIGALVVDNGWATERQVARALATALHLPLMDLHRTQVEPSATRLLPRSVAERHGVLVLGRENGPTGPLRIAVVDPTNVVALDDVRMYTGANDLAICVAADTDLRDALGRAWSLDQDHTAAALLDDVDSPEEEEHVSAVEDAPVVRLVDMILTDAIRLNASDVHVEVQRDKVRIRFRVDGLLRDVMTAPRSAAGTLISRLKILGGLDIAERRRPQDGRARFAAEGKQVDCRMSTLPSLHGEKVVLRLLMRSVDLPPIEAIGLERAQLDLLLSAVSEPQGLVLITGPTGSGKTSTLYAVINKITAPEKNIVTLEDPVEIAFPGITQVPIFERTGLTFASGLRSILRQDPDVILVGEVRDLETAELALQASLTGHLVLSTLHTNDAVGAVARLVDMGAQIFLIAGSLSVVIAQRLVRRPCTECIAPYRPEPRVLDLLGLRQEDLADATPMRGRGCHLCGDSGFRGRLGVFEVLPITNAIRQTLLTGADERSLAAAARGTGMRTMRDNALAKAMRGETTFEEVIRVTTVETHVDTSVLCTSCGGGMSDDMVACPWCGASSDRAHCGQCGKPLEPGWRTCPWCRHQVPMPPTP